MRRLVIVAAAVGWACSLVNAQNPVPLLLPSASHLQLTLQEDPNTAIRWGPVCAGEGEDAVRCHNFTISLENKSMDRVLLDSNCRERVFTISIRDPSASGGWLPAGRGGFPCHRGIHSTSLHLQPGEKISFQSGFISLSRENRLLSQVSYTLHAPYTVRATLMLRGCIEPSDHTDCLSPSQVTPSTAVSVSGTHLQEPVTLVSNEIIAESPNVLDLGEMKFEFQVDIDTAATSEIGTRGGCTRQNTARLDCTTFRYKIRNLGDRAVRNVVWNCNVGTDPDITPEYRVTGGEWQALPSRWVCGISTFSSTAEIKAGDTAEGKFNLATLHYGYSAKPLEAPGKYQLRFKFSPHACFASPDGGSCATVIQHPPPILSPEVTVDVP